MEAHPNILIVIPARGNSKGIPRKNLRSLNGKPLIWYSINNALASRWKPTVYLSSDDAEIKSIAKKCGAKIIDRAAGLAQDKTTLDPVIYDAYMQAKSLEGKDFELIVTLQPTSPLLKTRSLDSAIEKMLGNTDIDTLISATEDTHLSWLRVGDEYVANYEKRVNRQELTPVYRETGGFLICRNTTISEAGRIGKTVDLFALQSPESIDIDTFEDWNICNYYLSRRRILFVVSGYAAIGLGHVYRSLNIANEILDHEVLFLFDKPSQLGRDMVMQYHYPTYIQESEDILKDIQDLAPDIVINDILDTSEAYVKALHIIADHVINFEDLGPGSFLSALTINAMYQSPESEGDPRYFGFEYAIMRDEFLLSPKLKLKEKVTRVLITFGGTDPNDFSRKVLRTIAPFCAKHKIKIDIVLGMGYARQLESPNEGVRIFSKVNNMSEIMLNSDIAFSSAGRTTLELATLGIPTIVMCQNERETTHRFPDPEHGFINLGLGAAISDEALFDVFLQGLEYGWRKESHQKMLDLDLSNGKSRVLELIYNCIRSK